MEPTINDWRRHFDPETIDHLQGLQLPAPLRAEGRLAGHRRNPRIGGSADFAQHRQYVPGDDLRLVDWKVFGRTDRFFLKQREDESNLVCHLVIDASGSMSYQGQRATCDKLEYARRWAAAVAFVALHHRDGISLAAFDTQPRRIMPPANGGPGWVRVVAEALDRITHGGETDLATVLTQTVQRTPRRGLIMIISDFLDDAEQVCSAIRAIARRGHRLVLVQVADPDEVELPWTMPVRLTGLEGEQPLEVDPLAVRRAYRDAYQHLCQQIAETCHSVAASYLHVCTDQKIAPLLSKWLIGGASR